MGGWTDGWRGVGDDEMEEDGKGMEGRIYGGQGRDARRKGYSRKDTSRKRYADRLDGAIQ